MTSLNFFKSIHHSFIYRLSFSSSSVTKIINNYPGQFFSHGFTFLLFYSFPFSSPSLSLSSSLSPSLFSHDKKRSNPNTNDLHNLSNNPFLPLLLVQLLEQEKHGLKRRLDTLASEYDSQILELQSELNQAKKSMEEMQVLMRQTEKEKAQVVQELIEQNHRLTRELKEVIFSLSFHLFCFHFFFRL